VRNLLGSGHDADLIQGPDFRTQAAVDAEHFAVDDGGQGEEVEDLAAGLPDRGVAVLLLALFVETVDLGDLPALVVPAHQRHLVGISNYTSVLLRHRMGMQR